MFDSGMLCFLAGCGGGKNGKSIEGDLQNLKHGSDFGGGFACRFVGRRQTDRIYSLYRSVRIYGAQISRWFDRLREER